MRIGDGATSVLSETGNDPRGRLEGVVANWPTPTVRDHKGGGTAMTRADGKIRNDMLDWVAESWATPRSSDGEKGGPNQSFGAGGMPLPAQAAQWMTPRAHEVGQYQYDRGNKDRPIPTLTGQATGWATPTTRAHRKSAKAMRAFVDGGAVEPTGDRAAGGDAIPVFPPGPGDIDGWRAVLARASELEPAVRRVADGLATGVDKTRIDELRLLGNGVVPLAAANALRTLVARLAARGVARAVELARVMGVLS